MKKKFKEIALQAGGSHYPEVGGELLEKFGELVVQECLSRLNELRLPEVLDGQSDHDVGYNQGIDNSIYNSVIGEIQQSGNLI